MKRRTFLENTFIASAGLALPANILEASHAGRLTSDYVSNWHTLPDRIWTGEALWANRLQDWQITDGGLECIIRGRNRSVALLTHALSSDPQPFAMSVKVRFLAGAQEGDFAGFLLGRKGPVDDYRSAAIYGGGLKIGLGVNGKILIGDKVSQTGLGTMYQHSPVLLTLTATPVDNDAYNVKVQIGDGQKVLVESSLIQIPARELAGGLALVSDCMTKSQQELISSVRFENWSVSGPKLISNPSHTYGPIYFAQYTLNKDTIKLSAQMAPVGSGTEEVHLEIREGSNWKSVATSQVDPSSRVAAFRLTGWKFKVKMPYRLTYRLQDREGRLVPYHYEGTFTPAPDVTKPVKLGLFSCNCDHGFPDADLRDNILHHNIDAALFLGDQFYEASGGFSVEETNLERSTLDYLRKWYQFGWSYRDVFRHVPCISIPDDHDVYHGNVWGEGGELALKTGGAAQRQDSGGYKMDPAWVTMVQHTQCSHLPDPYDPTPVKNGIEVYYTHWNWGPLSFAIIEDRKFKSAPLHTFPEEAGIRNGFITNASFKDEEYLNASHAELLGARQERFLEDWVNDWQHGAHMKILLSQTNFCTLGTLPKGSTGDDIVPKLAMPKLGEYVKGDAPTKDMDSNGWPHSKRNRAVDIIRRGFTLHLAGDQHLASVVRYGVDEHDDAGFVFAGPALNNVWPRRWWPELASDHQPLPGQPAYTGAFHDGFKNKITVHAAASPRDTGLKPAIIHDRATGYGMVLIDPNSREITFECWKRSAKPGVSGADGQYAGWPVTIKQSQNYGRKPFGYLPEIESVNKDKPVIQVINERNQKTEYTIRIEGKRFLPMVFEDGRYTVRIGEPDTNQWKELKGLRPGKAGKVIRVKG
jgi:alkaline phosphatase D